MEKKIANQGLNHICTCSKKTING